MRSPEFMALPYSDWRMSLCAERRLPGKVIGRRLGSQARLWYAGSGRGAGLRRPGPGPSSPGRARWFRPDDGVPGAVIGR